ncbi:M48 family metallopeptidase [Pseudomonas sp.]|uniref:tetratricopeptide repeat protein n=1 Tax=Pseudomonas sp. TaxID=306 RepID=UPI002732944E|nr:tetratricopeptide repeat protein [Pseudomonas sp.]MDP3814162.1 tetratricopeptide repeat protein [Pseudomonas sp.]
MNKWLIPALTASLVLGGCASVPRGSVPVVDAGSSASSQQPAGQGGYGAQSAQTQSLPEDSGVVVMVPGAGMSSAPIQSFPASSAPIESSGSQPWSAPGAGSQGGYVAPAPAPSGGLALDEQLDGPVLALLTTAQQQQSGGDLNGAASSLERAQRIAPREPQVLYRLAEVRLAQGDAAQAEQFARRGLSYASGRPALQASLWNLIAQARERQGDPVGAAQAREQARVSL